MTAPPVADTARALGIDLDQPEDVNAPAARDAIAERSPTAVAVCAFGALIAEPLLSDYELINIHPSLLPRWRGAAPIERAIMAGDAATGVSIMRVVAALDAGPVALAEAVPITRADTYGTLAAALEELATRLLIRVLRDRPAYAEQPAAGVTYADKITAADRTLDPAAAAIAQERVVRALHPHIGARMRLDDGSFLGVRRARAHEDGTLELLEVQPAGGRPMPYADYVRGR